MSSGSASCLPIASALGAVGVLTEEGKDRGLLHFGTDGNGRFVTAKSTSPVAPGVSTEHIWSPLPCRYSPGR